MPTSKNTPANVVIHVRTIDARRRVSGGAGVLHALNAPRLRSFVRAVLSCAFLALAARYRSSLYDKPARGTGQPREDNSIYLRPALGYEFAEKMRAEAFYQYRRSRSNQAADSFESNEAGLQVTMFF